MALIIDHQVATATLKITFGAGVGSALFVQREAHRFLMTAAHVCEGIAAGNKIGISNNDKWKYVDVIGVQRCPKGSDVCVLRLNDEQGGGFAWDQLDAQVFVGETIAYCGYPLSLQMLNIPNMEGFPHPIVKSGCVSAFFYPDSGTEYLIDTLNNKGFSGGPVVRLDGKTPKIFALVSSYKFDSPSPVYRKNEQGEFEQVPDYFVQPNSGFMRAVCINQAKEAALMLI